MNNIDILRKTPLPSEEMMQIQSEVLDPVISTESLVRFQVPRAGILRSGSMITFKVKSDTDNDCFWPLKTGCFALFDRVELMLGGKRIQSVDKSALYNTIKRQVQSQDYKYGIDMVQKGAVDRVCNSTADDGTMMLRDGIETTDNSVLPAQYRITKTNPTEWAVRMDELFPMLHDLSLPLGNLNENLFVNLYLNKQDGTGGISDGPIGLFTKAYSGNKAVTADLTSFQLVADILYFSEERQQQLADAMMTEEGLNVLTDDVITVVNQQPQINNAAISEREQNIQLSLTGLSVKNVVVADRNKEYTGADIGLLGPYTSQAYAKPNTIQLRMNDMLVYPRPVSNEQFKIKELGDCFQDDFNVSSSEYSYNQISTKTGNHDLDNKIISEGKTFHGFKEFDSLAGLSHFEGISVSVPRNGRQGITAKKMMQLERKTNPSPSVSANDTREITIFNTVEKMVSFRNGMLQTVS